MGNLHTSSVWREEAKLGAIGHISAVRQLKGFDSLLKAVDRIAAEEMSTALAAADYRTAATIFAGIAARIERGELAGRIRSDPMTLNLAVLLPERDFIVEHALLEAETRAIEIRSLAEKLLRSVACQPTVALEFWSSTIAHRAESIGAYRLGRAASSAARAFSAGNREEGVSWTRRLVTLLHTIFAEIAEIRQQIEDDQPERNEDAART